MLFIAHELAFEYFGGVPHKIVYDQDKVFLVKENLGDLILTRGFRALVREHGFEPVFCRKSDPESKGKIENIVKYVKYNFLRGREFSDVDLLNKAPTEWAKTLDDEVLASAILDRLLYHCEVIKLSGQSYLMGNRKSIFDNENAMNVDE